jgi:hypothetical protein
MMLFMMLVDHLLVNTTHLLIMLFFIRRLIMVLGDRFRFDSLFLLDAGLGILRGSGLLDLTGVGAAAIGPWCSLLAWSPLGKSAILVPAQLLLDLTIAGDGCPSIAETRLRSNDIPVNLQEILSALSGKVSYRARVVNENPQDSPMTKVR